MRPVALSRIYLQVLFSAFYWYLPYNQKNIQIKCTGELSHFQKTHGMWTMVCPLTGEEMKAQELSGLQRSYLGTSRSTWKVKRAHRGCFAAVTCAHHVTLQILSWPHRTPEWWHVKGFPWSTISDSFEHYFKTLGLKGPVTCQGNPVCFEIQFESTGKQCSPLSQLNASPLHSPKSHQKWTFLRPRCIQGRD